MPSLETRRATIHYDQSGAGPDLIWVAGGGGLGSGWRAYQTPFFDDEYRSLTYDNRGVGSTRCDEPLPWSIADMADDLVALVEGVCTPPVHFVGLSMGALILTELALSRPDLVRCAVAMGTVAAGHVGWTGDFMRAEVELRRRGVRLEGLFAATHYAPLSYPARALGDDAMWAMIKERLLQPAWVEQNEESLIAQWQACIDFDVRDRLPAMQPPFHVFAFELDTQAPPQYGEEVARLSGGTLHSFPGMGHVSIEGHTHDILNPHIREILRSYP